MTGHRIHIKGFTEKSGKLKPGKSGFRKTLAQKKSASKKMRFVQASKSINRP